MLVCCFAITQGAWAINDVVFTETFDTNNGTGGKDSKFDGNIASSNAQFDNEGWEITLVNKNKKVYGAYQCVKFGDSSNNGTLTTPSITPGATYALLTFSAAGWGDTKTNTLTITATDGIGLTGDTDITLENEEWLDYSVLINTNGASNFKIIFTGKRGFLDDVVVRRVDLVEAPTLPTSDTFWPNTTEAATKSITLSPANFTSIRYTTNGTTPTTTTGTLVTASSTIVLSATTTIKAIAYIGTIASEVTTRTYTLGTTNVNSISAFNNLPKNTEARLFLSPAQNARVLHGLDGKMYLRDNTGTLCVDLETSAAFNPTPVHNQHVAGWIVGKKQTANGLAKLVATCNTNTNHLALAAPVTESATAPNAIAIDDINNNVGDWVKVNDVRNDGSPIAVSSIYNNALVDVSGIVTANNMITPVNYADIKPVVYVIDEDKAFTSPDADITGATIRLKRTLKKDIWNTFAVPFDITSFSGKIREMGSATDNRINFIAATEMNAGTPYLVKPNADIENPVFDNVTLSNVEAATVTLGDFSFIATYEPVNLATDKTEQFLTASGKLAYPSSSATATLKGMRAFFRVPANATARITIDGEEITGIENAVESSKLIVESYYDLQGRKVVNPMKGLYFANGKKVFIK